QSPNLYRVFFRLLPRLYYGPAAPVLGGCRASTASKRGWRSACCELDRPGCRRRRLKLPFPLAYDIPQRGINPAIGKRGLTGARSVKGEFPKMTTNELLVPPPPPIPSVCSAPAPLTGRDANGRFTVGNSGRPRGARNRVNAEIDQLLEEAAPDAFT